MGKKTSDQVFVAYGNYGQAEALARLGFQEEAQMRGELALSDCTRFGSIFICMANAQIGRVFLQGADYKKARVHIGKALRDIPRLRFMEITAPIFALFSESILENHWLTSRRGMSWSDRVKCKWSLRLGWFAGLLFPNVRPLTYRILGRFAIFQGRSKRGTKYFNRAIEEAEKIGADYELARTLIDKSLLDYPEAQLDREKGLALLESLGCVLPDAEVDYLGIDRAEHHARAASAREHHHERLDD